MAISPEHIISDEAAALFFFNLKKELNCKSTRKIVTLVRVIMSKIRTSYTAQQLTAIVSKTPSWFHLLMLGDWQSNDGKEIHHIDELVDEIINSVDLRDSGFVKSEIDGLSSVIAVLNRIHQLFKPAGINPLNYTLANELNYAI